MDPVTTAAQYRTVVIEGCDGTGKTTLARRLTGKHGFSFIHATRTPDHLDLTTRYLHMLDTDSRLVMDRSFVSELVYGPLQRGRSRLTWAQVLDLAEAVTQRNGAFIHLTAPVDVVHARLLLRDGEADEPDILTGLLAAYERAFHTLADHATVITIDTAQHDLRSLG